MNSSRLHHFLRALFGIDDVVVCIRSDGKEEHIAKARNSLIPTTSESTTTTTGGGGGSGRQARVSCK